MFLGAAALTLLAFTLRRATSRRLHAGWKRRLARATARHPCLLGPHGGLSVALCILEELQRLCHSRLRHGRQPRPTLLIRKHSTRPGLRAGSHIWSARSDGTAAQRHTRAAQAASVRRAAAPSLLGSTPVSTGGLRRRANSLTSPTSGVTPQQLRQGSPGVSRRTSQERPPGANGEDSTKLQMPPVLASTPATTPAPTPTPRLGASDVLTESLAEGGALMSAANAAATQGPQALLTFVATQISTLREE